MRRDFYAPSTSDEEQTAPLADDDLQRGRQAVAHARRLLRGDTDTARRTRVGLAVIGSIGALAAAAPMLAAVQEQPQAPAPESPAASPPETTSGVANSSATLNPVVTKLDQGEELLRTLARSVEAAEKTVTPTTRNSATALEKALPAITEAKDKATSAAAMLDELLPAVEQLGDIELSQRATAARQTATTLAARASTAWDRHRKAVDDAHQTQRVADARAADTAATRAVATAEDTVRGIRELLTGVATGLRDRKPALQVEGLLTQARTSLDEAPATITAARKAVEAAQSTSDAQPGRTAKSLLDRMQHLEQALTMARAEVPALLDKVARLRQSETADLAATAAQVAADAVTSTRQALDSASSHLDNAQTQRAAQDPAAAVRATAVAAARLNQAHQLQATADQALRTAEGAQPAGPATAEFSGPARALTTATTANTANTERLASLDQRLQALAESLASQPVPTAHTSPSTAPTRPAPAVAPAGQAAGVTVQLPGGRGTVQAPNAKAASAVRSALSQLGVRYVWGGQQPGRGFDCSGLTSWAYRQAGVHLPRVSRAQTVGARVQAGDLKPGDLVVWAGHVAMYVGNGLMVEAGSPVQISRVRTTNLKMKFLGFYRPTS
ncbi:C40 family peptidase [Crossiella cryophila]|uniref:Cell wall-associated NlpC family hydrolase n=1 Tax=Crossiella cryophila TaxID=43355 RepID=A0A7W7C9X4_9PSEU|nr:NlpC/P60 family protein [Crossiella cryophila]MBB4677249.1 cell wall-associated NlpC family hydrolase [Crossiella cryophila]